MPPPVELTDLHPMLNFSIEECTGLFYSSYWNRDDKKEAVIRYGLFNGLDLDFINKDRRVESCCVGQC